MVSLFLGLFKVL